METNGGTGCDPRVGDRCCLRIIIEDAPRFIPGNGWQGGQGLLGYWNGLAAAPIELKPKGLAEGGQSPLGGIGLGGFKGNVMHLARGDPSTFPAALPLADDRGALCLNRQPYPGDIDGKEGAFVLPGEHTLGVQGLSRPP